MSIKRKAFIGLATLLLSAGSGYYYFTNHFVPTTVVNASFTENFADLSVLMQNSDIIVKGTIKKEIGSFHPYPKAAYTDYVFEVTDLISGVLNENEITVTQKGGEVSFEDLNGKVLREKVIMDKHPLFQPGESYILFLNYSKEDQRYYVGSLGYGAYLLKNDKAINNYPGLTKSERIIIREIKSIKKTESKENN